MTWSRPFRQVVLWHVFSARIEIRDLIKQLGQTYTVIFSFHILSEVQAICEKVLIIAKGRLVAFDEPERLKKLLLTSNSISFVTEAQQNEAEEILGGLPSGG